MAVLRLVPGPRAGEEVVLAWIATHLPRPGQGPIQPLRVIVPSRSLRQHLGAVLVRRAGRALAGVQVQTLYTAAREILAAGGDGVRDGGPLLAVLSRRLAHLEPELERPLGRLADGLAAAAATVRDLLDAGLVASDLPVLEELAANASDATLPERQRAAALLRVAAAMDRLRRTTGLDDRGRTYLRAAERLAAEPTRLAGGRVLIWGFVEATGAATALLAALVRRSDADVLIDVPAAPSLAPEPAAPAPGGATSTDASPRGQGAGAGATASVLRAAPGAGPDRHPASAAGAAAPSVAAGALPSGNASLGTWIPEPGGARFARRLCNALTLAGGQLVAPPAWRSRGAAGSPAGTPPDDPADLLALQPAPPLARQITLFAAGAGAEPATGNAATRGEVARGAAGTPAAADPMGGHGAGRGGSTTPSGTTTTAEGNHGSAVSAQAGTASLRTSALPVDLTAARESTEPLNTSSVPVADPTTNPPSGSPVSVRSTAPASSLGAAAPRTQPAHLTAFLAADPDGEAREVARRLRAALDAGAVPERLLVVARDLGPVRTALARHFGRLGVPFSDLGGNGPPGPTAARVAAFTALLAEGERLSVDRWLALLAAGQSSGADATLPVGDLRLAFAVLGAGRLGAVADLDIEARLGNRPGLPLPVRRGISDPQAELDAALPSDGDEEDGELTALVIDPPLAHSTLELELPTSANGTARGQLALALAPANAVRRPPPPPVAAAAAVGSLERRQVAAALLRRLVASARALVRHLASWPRRAPWGAQRAHLVATFELLGWTADTSPALTAVLQSFTPMVPATLDLEREEVARLLSETLGRHAGAPLGGAGGGVQVLTATEARGRTAEQLFLIGLLRGQFPRTVREDPLLGDALRQHLRVALPDLPVKTEGHDEERHLFASLLAAAPTVTLSWSARGDAGEPVAPSPLVDELAWRHGLVAEVIPGALEPTAPGPHTPAEEAMRAGLGGSRAQALDTWPAALAVIRAEALRNHQSHPPPGFPPAPVDQLPPVSTLAVVRGRILDELDPDLRTPGGRQRRDLPGPYLGLLAAVAPGDEADPRTRTLGVTALETMATCPWLLFLRQGLGLAPPVEALGVLPEVDARLLGTVVHAMLARLVHDARRTRDGLGPDRRPADDRGRREAKPAVGSHPHRPAEPPRATSSGDQRLDIARAKELAPISPAWPDAATLLAFTRSEAERALRDEGRELPGLAEALARAAQPLLAVAREEDREAGLGVLAAEVDAPFRLPDGTTLRARADRLDRLADGTLRLIDWKTGRLRGPLGSPPAQLRLQPLLARVTSGQALQVPAYLLAMADAAATERREGGAALARLASLRPDLADRERNLSAYADDHELLARFTSVASVLLAAWRAGTVVPRLVDPSGHDEPTACRSCELRLACHRGDSGLRRRIAHWLTAQHRADDGADAWRATLDAVWHLHHVAHPAAPPGGGNGSTGDDGQLGTGGPAT